MSAVPAGSRLGDRDLAAHAPDGAGARDGVLAPSGARAPGSARAPGGVPAAGRPWFAYAGAAWAASYLPVHLYWAAGGAMPAIGIHAIGTRFALANVAACIVISGAGLTCLSLVQRWGALLPGALRHGTAWFGGVVGVAHAATFGAMAVARLSGLAAYPGGTGLSRAELHAYDIANLVYFEPWFAVMGAALIATSWYARRYRMAASAGHGACQVAASALLFAGVAVTVAGTMTVRTWLFAVAGPALLLAGFGVMTAAVRLRKASAAGFAGGARARIGLSVAMGAWALCYAVYRGYYAAGGTWFLTGTLRPGSEGEFQLINLAGAVVIGIAAMLPVAVLPLWRRRRVRRVLLALCWAVAVGCCMHALIDMTDRVLSLAGLVQVHYGPLWASVDHRAADLQDLFGNEPWFCLEGLAFGALGWTGLGPGRPRRWWAVTVAAGIAALTLIGLLSATGVIGTFIVA